MLVRSMKAVLVTVLLSSIYNVESQTATGAQPAQKAKASTPIARPAPQLTAEQRQFMEARTKALEDAGAKEAKTTAEYAVVLEKAARSLKKDFPENEGVNDLLLQAAGYAEPDKGRELANEVIKNSTNDRSKERAQGLVKKFDRLNKPIDLKFTAVDGREVDIQKLKGKVVLIDFWATWCGPCIAELPNVIKAYEKLNPKGFEIVGISFDRENDKEKLEKFVVDRKMPWPQFFDGKYWSNTFGREFGINSIPAMWLVDKKGVLRDLNARGKLEEKVEKLLAE